MQRWWIVGVAVVGIALAVLLFPRPDTGDIPEPNPKIVDPLDFETPGKASKQKMKAVTGPRPGMERLIELRSQPDAVYAGKLTAPWSAVRYALLKEFPEDDTEAAEIADDIRTVLATLQSGRRDPTMVPPLAETVESLESLEERLESSPRFTENETIAKGLKRYALTLTEYHAANRDGNAPEEAE